MTRFPSTTVYGAVFSTAEIVAVWAKAVIVPGYDPSLYRKDQCGVWIAWSEYGQISNWGWEIDHIMPVSKGGSDHLDNLQPLHWQNNRGKSDNYPHWSCTVPASV